MKTVLLASFIILAILALPLRSCEASLVVRTGRPTCWVKWQAGHDWICVPKDLWIQSFQTHIKGFGHWSVSSPLENEGDPKVQIRTFHFSDAIPATPSSLSERIQVSVESFREELSDSLHENFPDSFGILAHLLLGESKSDDHTAFFRDLGFIHLFSASGIHLYALGFLVGLLFLGMGRFFRFPVLPWLWLSRAMTFMAWMWGWLLSGLRLGMLRPLLLLLIQRVAKLRGFRWRKWTPLCLALSLDLLISVAILRLNGEPLSNFNWSEGRAFYLLAICGGALLEKDERQHHLSLSIASWLLDAIWDAASWGMLTCMTPLLSLITIPLITLIIYPALILFSLTHAFSVKSTAFIQILKALFFLLEKFMTLVFRFSLHTGNVWIVSPSTVLLMIVLITLIFLLPRHYRIYFLATVGSIILAFRLLVQPAPIIGTATADEVTQLDVGQGDSALVLDRKRKNAGLIDTGSIHALTDSAWIRVLANRGINHLQWIGLTHLDEDHSGGALRLARLLPIDCVATSDAELKTDRGENYEKELKAMDVRVDHHLVSCVPYPSREPAAPNTGPHEANENMSAFLIPLRDSGFYLSAGDATESDELKIADWALSLPPVQSSSNGSPRILKISHHGSKTSTSQKWLNEINPTEAWISVGVGNHYGHPAPVVLSLLEKNGIPTRRTDISGALSSGKTVQVKSARSQK